jgi:lipoprotein NlpI
MAYAALGQRDAALNEFNQALAFNPLFADAQMVRTEVENGTFVAAAAP